MVEIDVIKSYAKINLGLWITEKREDNYHNIVTVFHKIGLHDIITITPHWEFEILAWGAPQSKENIIYKVKELVEKKFGITLTYRVEIKKNIPIGSGLGGASSNAAYFLRYLNEKRNLGLSTSELVELGSEIGADVPFFLISENAAIATGKGNILEPFKSTFNFPLIVGFPPCQVMTPWAYDTFDRANKFSKFSEAYKNAVRIAEALKNNNLGGILDLRNDFEEAVQSQYPVIFEYKELMYNLGAKIVSMSGSGSAIFGIFERMIFLENFGEDLKPSMFLEIE